MKLPILFFVWYLGLASCTVEDLNSGGQTEAPHWALKYQASVRQGVGWKMVHRCSAMSVFEDHILTAGDCLKQEDKDLALLPQKYNVLLGTHDIEVDEDINMADANPSSPYLFNVVNSNEHIDPEVNMLSLHILPVRQKLGAKIEYATLPDSTEDFTGQECISSGWGSAKEGCEVFQKLQIIKVQVLPDDKCHGQPKNSICATRNDENTFRGDLGGPLLCQTKAGSWVLAGVLTSGHSCLERSDILVFTKITDQVLKWLEFVKEEYLILKNRRADEPKQWDEL